MAELHELAKANVTMGSQRPASVNRRIRPPTKATYFYVFRL